MEIAPSLSLVLGDDCLDHLSWTKKQHAAAIGLMPSDSFRKDLSEFGGIPYDQFAAENRIWSLR
jgi:hypothetical protein